MEGSVFDNGFIWLQLILYQVYSLALIQVVTRHKTTLDRVKNIV